MNVMLVPGTMRVAPSYPVELAATVDGETLRLAIEWPVIERWLGERATNVDAVREALHVTPQRHRAHESCASCTRTPDSDLRRSSR